MTRSVHRAAVAAAAVLLGALLVAVARADVVAFRGNPWLLAADLAVGLAFVAAAVAAGGSRAERVLIAGIGVAWLAASLVGPLRGVHQSLLIVALVAFPAGRIRGVPRRVLAGAGAVVGLGVLSPVAVAVVFAAVAVVRFAGRATDRIGARYPVAAAAGIASVLVVVGVWPSVAPGSFVPQAALLGYELALIAIAAGFPLAVAAVVRDRTRLADRVLSADRPAGLDGLVPLLRLATGDPTLQVRKLVWPPERPRPGRGTLIVHDDGGPVAAIEHRPSTLEDPVTADAAATAVRLAVANARLVEQERVRLRELQQARVRILAAADRQRERAAAELHERVDVGCGSPATSSERCAPM